MPEKSFNGAGLLSLRLVPRVPYEGWEVGSVCHVKLRILGNAVTGVIELIMVAEFNVSRQSYQCQCDLRSFLGPNILHSILNRSINMISWEDRSSECHSRDCPRFHLCRGVQEHPISNLAPQIPPQNLVFATRPRRPREWLRERRD